MKAQRKPDGFASDISGAAALEFALIAPILIFGALAAIDVGMSTHESFEIDRALRAAAELAIDDPGAAVIEDALSDIESDGDRAAGVSWSAARYCACPEAPASSVSCYSTCADSRPTGIYYRIQGTQSYQGLFLPTRVLQREAKVRAR